MSDQYSSSADSTTEPLIECYVSTAQMRHSESLQRRSRVTVSLLMLALLVSGALWKYSQTFPKAKQRQAVGASVEPLTPGLTAIYEIAVSPDESTFYLRNNKGQLTEYRPGRGEETLTCSHSVERVFPSRKSGTGQFRITSLFANPNRDQKSDTYLLPAEMELIGAKMLDQRSLLILSVYDESQQKQHVQQMNRLMLIDLKTGTRVWDLPTSSTMYDFALDEEQDEVFCVSSGGLFRWNLSTGELNQLSQESILSLCYLPESDLLVTGTTRGVIQTRKASDGTVLSVIPRNSKTPVKTIISHPSLPGKVVYSSDTNRLLIWDAVNDCPWESIQIPDGLIYTYCFSPSGDHIYVSGSDNSVWSWNRTQLTTREVFSLNRSQKI